MGTLAGLMGIVASVMHLFYRFIALIHGAHHSWREFNSPRNCDISFCRCMYVNFAPGLVMGGGARWVGPGPWIEGGPKRPRSDLIICHKCIYYFRITPCNAKNCLVSSSSEHVLRVLYPVRDWWSSIRQQFIHCNTTGIPMLILLKMQIRWK